MDTKKYKKKNQWNKSSLEKKEEKINKIDKPIVKLTKRRRENTL
jgi:chorismate mutase